MSLTKYSPKNSTPAKPHKSPIKVKHVMSLDTGDGAFTDASVKVKPHHENPNLLVLKCTDLKRLCAAAEEVGMLERPIFKGSKHYIAFVWKGGESAKILGKVGMPLNPKQFVIPVKAITTGGAK